MTGDYVSLAALAAVVGIGAAFDLRTRKVPVLLLVFGVVVLCAGTLLPNSLTMHERLFGLIPGVLLLLSGILWHLIGTGDSVLILMAGFGMGFRGFCFFLLISLMCLLPTSLLLIVVRKIGRKDTLPFYPFAAVGFVITLLLRFVP